MKGFLSLLSFLTVASFTQAQGISFAICNKWCARADTLLLFPRGNNLIQIVCTGIEPEQLTIKSLDNALKIASPEIKGDTILILSMPYPKYGKKMRLSIADKKTKKQLATVVFNAELEPAPIAQVSQFTGDHIARSQLLSKPFIRVVFPNSLYAYPYRIKQFTFKTRANGKDVSIAWKGANIGQNIQDLIKTLPDGTFIEFTDIKATCPDCAERTLDPLRMWLK